MLDYVRALFYSLIVVYVVLCKQDSSLADYDGLSQNPWFIIFTPWLLEAVQPCNKKLLWKILQSEQKERKAVCERTFLCSLHRWKTKMKLITWTPDPKDCTLPWLSPSVISLICCGNWTGHFLSLSVCFLLASPLLLATWTSVSEFWSQGPSEEQNKLKPWLTSCCLVVILLDLQNNLLKMASV